MNKVVYNYVGENIQETGRVFFEIMKCIKKSNIRITPLHDEYISKFGVWLEGGIEEMDSIKEKLGNILRKKEINFHLLEWHPRMGAGK